MVVMFFVVVLVMVMVVLMTVVEVVLRGCKIFPTSILYKFFLICSHKKIYIPCSNGPLIIAFTLKAKSTTVELFWI
jgi:hypothetical protein